MSKLLWYFKTLTTQDTWRKAQPWQISAASVQAGTTSTRWDRSAWIGQKRRAATGQPTAADRYMWMRKDKNPTIIIQILSFSNFTFCRRWFLVRNSSNSLISYKTYTRLLVSVITVIRDTQASLMFHIDRSKWHNPSLINQQFLWLRRQPPIFVIWPVLLFSTT